MEQAEKLKKTLEDLRKLPTDTRADLIDGQIYIIAPASSEHSRIQGKICSKIDQIQETKKKSGEPYWIILSEAWTKYDKHNAFVHDIAAFSSYHYEPKNTVQTARPLWVCEIISPSNWRKDTQDIRSKLEHFRVPYYWIVDPIRKEVLVLALDSGASRYSVITSVGPGENIEIEPFLGIEVNTDDIFVP